MQQLATQDMELLNIFQAEEIKKTQIPLKTLHNFHAGCYARTIMIPAGVQIVSAVIKIPTMVIMCGDATISGVGRFQGYHVLQGDEGRKNAYLAHSDTWLTMIFATEVQSVEEAEKVFTDDYELLGSRNGGA